MDIIRGLECGADNFLTKPYKEDQLIARVHDSGEPELAPRLRRARR